MAHTEELKSKSVKSGTGSSCAVYCDGFEGACAPAIGNCSNRVDAKQGHPCIFECLGKCVKMRPIMRNAYLKPPKSAQRVALS